MPESRQLLADARRAAILEMLRASGNVTVGQIERALGVSSMTARGDLAELERLGAARRNQVGAELPGPDLRPVAEDAFATRVQLAEGSKEVIGRTAAGMVQDGHSVFLDSSSSAWFLARALLERGTRATVITNSLPIMELVSAHEGDGISLVAVGGTLRRPTMTFVGPEAVSAVGRHAPDLVFFSVRGVTDAGLMTDPDPHEAACKCLMLSRAGASVLLLDGSKLAARGLHVVGAVGDVSRVITHGLTPAGLRALRDAGARVTDAHPATGAA